jgi:hypothetical protein
MFSKKIYIIFFSGKEFFLKLKLFIKQDLLNWKSSTVKISNIIFFKQNLLNQNKSIIFGCGNFIMNP